MSSPTPPEPPTDEEIARLVREQLGFTAPPECLPGIRANLALLAEHVRRLESE